MSVFSSFFLTHSTRRQVEFLGMQQACVNACVPPAGANESSGAVGMNGAMLLTCPPAGPVSPCLPVSPA